LARGFEEIISNHTGVEALREITRVEDSGAAIRAGGKPGMAMAAIIGKIAPQIRRSISQNPVLHCLEILPASAIDLCGLAAMDLAVL
jgi:hypothetical protein